MNRLTQNRFAGLTRWVSDGPWRSKSVIAAFLITVVGLLSWISNVRSDPTWDDATNVATNTSAVVSADPASGPPATQWNWQGHFPSYAKVSASYVAGCCIGWFFRRLTRLILVICALAITLLGFGKYAGLDTAPARDHVRRGTDWARHELAETTEYLKHALPSAAGGGIGLFMGFWRRRKTGGVEPEQTEKTE
jgi:di/tricarboxylate transporter